jgi:hypothetical protein
LAIPSVAGVEWMKRLHAECSIAIRNEKIYRVAVIGAEARQCMFPIDRQVLPSAGREWRWTTIFVAPEFSADESHGQTNQHSRIRPRLS